MRISITFHHETFFIINVPMRIVFLEFLLKEQYNQGKRSFPLLKRSNAEFEFPDKRSLSFPFSFPTSEGESIWRN